MENHSRSVKEGLKSADYSVHGSAIVDDGARIGKGTKIWHFSHVCGSAKIGEKCVIGQNVYIAPNVVIGNNVKIQNNVSVYEGVVLEDDVFCGPSMVFTNVINPRSAVCRRDEFKNTLVKKGATIGANATVVCGHTVGRCAFIGAGTVVTKDVPDYALIIGVPGRIAGYMCECGIKLAFKKDSAVCASCTKRYIKKGDIVKKT
jgi:UDP-2-acetamido-3-amino-2,3-dideoxy-glucuronate N-acetyltransferase